METSEHQHATHCKCFCSIIPPHIIQELSKHGKVGIKHLQQHHELSIRSKRSDKINTVYGQSFLGTDGLGSRMIYDCNGSTILRSSLERTENGNPSQDAIVNSVFTNTGIVRDFFKTQYNYNSVDDHGASLILNVHYSKLFDNAFWDGDEMIFGDGDGVIFCNFATALDITAHELTHGVIQHTSGLVYDGQSGALNEHMADVFGVTIRQFKEGQADKPETANWLIGDSIMGPSLQGQAVRNMKAPGTAYDNPKMGKDQQPGHMSQYYSGDSDFHGVHLNSGIPNKVFYLTAVGLGDTLKTALLWFETLKALEPNDNFAVFKTKLLDKAGSLSGNKQIPDNAVRIATDAFTSVGL